MGPLIKNKWVIIGLSLVLAAAVGGNGCAYQPVQTIDASSGFNNQDKENVLSSELAALLEKVINPPIVTSHGSEEIIYSGSERQLIFVKGYATPGHKIQVYVNGLLQADSIRTDSDGFFETMEGLEVVEGRNRIEVTAVSGAQKSQSTKFNITVKVTDKIQYSIYQDSQNLKQIQDVYYLKDGYPLVYIAGNYLAASKIFLQVNDKIVSEGESDSEGIFSFSEVALRKGENDVSLWGMTQDGIISQPVSVSVLVTEDSESPYPSSLSGYNDGFGNHLSWSCSYDQNFYAYKLVRVTDPCLNPEYPDHDVVATFNDLEISSYTDEDAEEGHSYFYTLWTLDRAGNAISSNVLAMPAPVYSIDIEKIAPFGDNVIGRREWYYQYFKITNKGNVTIDLQPIMVWLKLDPEPDLDKNMWPLWEAHIWDPDSGQYYYSNEVIEQTYIADYWALDEITQIGEVYTYEDEEEKQIEVRDIITKQTRDGEGKRVMVTTTFTEEVETGNIVEGKEAETSQVLVGPEKIGSVIEDLKPGQSVKLAVKVQNISAGNGDRITLHFHFAPVDCAGYFYTDEEVSTRDITVISSGRN